LTAFVCCALLACGTARALDNGLARTPAMGWNAWNTFGCNVNEKLIHQVADALVSSGMRDAGYRYLVLDDCWMGGRDASGALQANRARFPSGMKAMGDYLHARGLLFGIYETPNTVTCAAMYSGYPKTLGVGSAGHEMHDARTFASWGVDYLKYDHCSGDYASFAKMRDALRATGRSIVYSINPEFGQDPLREHLPQLANSARVADDVEPNWASIMRVLDTGSNLAMLSQPGFWNDFDMLEVGNGMSASEDRVHFSMWAMEASPLLAGNDVRTMTARTREILENREVIAIDQDRLGVAATLEGEPSISTQVWTRPLATPGTYAVAFLNRGDEPAIIGLRWNWHLGFAGPATVRDLWKHEDLGTFDKSFDAIVAPHDVLLLKITRIKKKSEQTGA
jgi:alpha-galactosidase